MLECPIEDNHVYGLIKLVAKMYAVIRFHHLAKIMNDKDDEQKIRKKLSKLILFKNQCHFIVFKVERGHYI